MSAKHKNYQTEQATADFLVKMDRLEAEALAEIAALVRDTKRKILRIEERLYGGASNNSFLEFVLKLDRI